MAHYDFPALGGLKLDKLSRYGLTSRREESIPSTACAPVSTIQDAHGLPWNQVILLAGHP